MNTRMISKLVAAALAVVFGFVPAAHATTNYWSGATNANMSGTAGNWGGTVPGASDIATWDATAYTNSPTANAAMTLGKLWFTANNTTNVTFGSGANTLTLNGVSGIGIQIDSGSGVINLGSAKLKLGANQSWTNDNSLTVATLDLNGYALSLDGNGSISPTITGSGTVTKTGTGTYSAYYGSTYTGAFNFVQGRVVFSGTASGFSATTTLYLGDPDTTPGNTNSAALSESRNTGCTQLYPIVVTAGSTGTRAILSGQPSGSTGPIDYSGNITLNTNVTVAVYVHGNGGVVLSGVVSGTGGLNIGDNTYTNLGVVKLSNANTFTGTTTLKSAFLSITNSLALQNSTLDTDNIIRGNRYDGIKIDGMTSLTIGGLSGSKNLNGGNSANNYNLANSIFHNYNGSSYANLAALTLNPGVGVSSIYGGTITNGAAGMTLTKTGAGTQTLTNSLYYSGATIVSNGVLDVSNAPTFANTNWTIAASGTLKIGTKSLSGKNLTIGVDGVGAGLLDMTGAKTLAGNLTVIGTSTVSRKIAQSTGTISGTFGTTSLPSGFVLTTRNSGKELWVGASAGTMVRFF
ncbi:MAG: autotransporter-associated beta strand repeat-containing protein [bacterium]